MAEINATINEEEQVFDTNKMYLEQIENLKKNTVSKDDYQRLLNDNRNLLDTIVNGQAQATAEPVKEKVDVEKLKAELFYPKRELSNLEYVEKALELRDAVLEQEGTDIFVAGKHGQAPTQEAYDSAQRFADVARNAIERADGSSEVFTAELMRHTNDNVVLPRR